MLVAFKRRFTDLTFAARYIDIVNKQLVLSFGAGLKFTHTLIDELTSWVEAIVIEHQHAETVVRVGYSLCISCIGAFEQIYSDSVAQFESALFNDSVVLLSASTKQERRQLLVATSKRLVCVLIARLSICYVKRSSVANTTENLAFIGCRKRINQRYLKLLTLNRIVSCMTIK